MILETYLKQNNTTFKQVHLASGIPQTTVRSIDKRDLDKWSIEYFEAIGKTIGKDKFEVIKELENLRSALENQVAPNEKKIAGRYNLENRRYIGNKNKLLSWIEELLLNHVSGDSFFDVFGGTGVVTKKILPNYNKFILNDFLFSNNTIFKAFFGDEKFDSSKINDYKNKFQKIESNHIDDDYFVDNYGNKFFSNQDARIIGEIRTQIEVNSELNEREKSILIASLIYSTDKIANTVGHYDAYRKNIDIKNRFVFELINPIDISNKKIDIFRKDANQLVREVKTDIAFIDPPYNSRQYSRFYHVLEGLAKWNKPDLSGVAMKPPVENMSDYSKTVAPIIFDDLIKNLNAKYIVVTYNNTYTSKSSSSKNKITHQEILESLNSVGETRVFEKPFQFFNAGKTELNGHKEFVFITEVKK